MVVIIDQINKLASMHRTYNNVIRGAKVGQEDVKEVNQVLSH